MTIIVIIIMVNFVFYKNGFLSQGLIFKSVREFKNIKLFKLK